MFMKISMNRLEVCCFERVKIEVIYKQSCSLNTFVQPLATFFQGISVIVMLYLTQDILLIFLTLQKRYLTARL
jgi:hypothetical protein